MQSWFCETYLFGLGVLFQPHENSSAEIAIIMNLWLGGTVATVTN